MRSSSTSKSRYQLRSPTNCGAEEMPAPIRFQPDLRGHLERRVGMRVGLGRQHVVGHDRADLGLGEQQEAAEAHADRDERIEVVPRRRQRPMPRGVEIRPRHSLAGLAGLRADAELRAPAAPAPPHRRCPPSGGSGGIGVGLVAHAAERRRRRRRYPPGSIADCRSAAPLAASPSRLSPRRPAADGTRSGASRRPPHPVRGSPPARQAAGPQRERPLRL